MRFPPMGAGVPVVHVQWSRCRSMTINAMTSPGDRAAASPHRVSAQATKVGGHITWLRGHDPSPLTMPQSCTRGRTAPRRRPEPLRDGGLRPYVPPREAARSALPLRDVRVSVKSARHKHSNNLTY